MLKITYMVAVLWISISLVSGCSSAPKINDFEKTRNQIDTIESSTQVGLEDSFETTEEIPLPTVQNESSSSDLETDKIEIAKQAMTYYFELEYSPEYTARFTEESVFFINSSDPQNNCFAEFNGDGRLTNIYVLGTLGGVADTSYEKQKTAAVEFIVDKALVESEEDLVFIGDFDDFIDGDGFVFEDKNHNEIIVGVNNQSGKVTMLFIMNGIPLGQ